MELGGEGSWAPRPAVGEDARGRPPLPRVGAPNPRFELAPSRCYWKGSTGGIDPPSTPPK